MKGREAEPHEEEEMGVEYGKCWGQMAKVQRDGLVLAEATAKKKKKKKNECRGTKNNRLIGLANPSSQLKLWDHKTETKEGTQWSFVTK